MLYHLVTLNPKKDITLHVSANNPAMVQFACSIVPALRLTEFYFSYFTIALVLKPKSLLLDFMTITLIRNPEHLRMHSDFDYDGDAVPSAKKSIGDDPKCLA
jgi:hypothetical protein